MLCFIGDVIKDQAEADEDSSLKERAKMAVGKGSVLYLLHFSIYTVIIYICENPLPRHESMFMRLSRIMVPLI